MLANIVVVAAIHSRYDHKLHYVYCNHLYYQLLLYMWHVTSRQVSLIDWLIPINYIMDACLFHVCYLYWCIDYITSGMKANSAARAYLWSNDNLLASKNCACCCFAQQRQNIPWPITANDILWIFSETECFQDNQN